MNKPYFAQVDPKEESLLSNLADLAPRLRPADKIQMQAMANMGPYAGLVTMTHEKGQRSWMIFDKHNKPQGIFGILLHDKYMGMPWLCTSEFVFENPMVFLRGCKEVFKTFTELTPLQAGFVWADNDVAIKWLKWLGYDIVTSSTVTMQNPEVPFYRFFYKNITE